MTTTKTYTYLGKTKRPESYHIIKGSYAVEAADLYTRLGKLQLDFPMISDIKEVLAVFPGEVGHTSNPVAISNALASAQAWDADVGWTNDTAAANNATANDMTLLPAVPALTDLYYFGGPVKFGRVRLIIGTPGVGVWTLTWEYYNGSAWVAIPGLVDGTAGFTASGNINFDPKGIPSWAAVAINGVTAYHIRARVSAYTSIVTQPLGTQAFIEKLGNMVVMAALEGAVTGTIMPEKSDGEAFGQIFTWGAIVAGV